MAGMHDVEIAGNERDALSGGDPAADFGRNRLSVKCLSHGILSAAIQLGRAQSRSGATRHCLKDFRRRVKDRAGSAGLPLHLDTMVSRP
jgi:hypothetical protein